MELITKQEEEGVLTLSVEDEIKAMNLQLEEIKKQGKVLEKELSIIFWFIAAFYMCSVLIWWSL